jgi:soluble lytic murein transglycosylase
VFGRDVGALGVLAVAVAGAGARCTRADLEGQAAPTRAVLAVDAADARPPAVADEPSDWASLVRDERWDAAWSVLDRLPDAEKSRPELRYLRARVALARGDAAAALPLLDGLEPRLPLLASDVERRRAEAELEVGPFSEAAEWFSSQPNLAAQLAAARAFEKAGDPRRARAAAERVMASDKKTRPEEAEARAIRARLATPIGQNDRDDVRWLATLGADTAAASDALELVQRLDPAEPLSARELLTRAQALAEAGRIDDALRTVDMVPSAAGAETLAKGERLRARALILYKARGRNGEAATAFAECAAAGGPDAADDAFHAARSLSRADRDEAAIRGYQDVQRRFPKTTWAEQATFMVPYLRMLHGQWPQCSAQFAEYVRRYPAGDKLRDARASGALCRLFAGDAKDARFAFERLVEDEPDPLLSARLANMAALAALRDGDRVHAVTRWTDVVRSRPLSWAALVAMAHLRDVGAAVPDSFDAQAQDPGFATALSITLPPPADLLHRLGLEQDAEAEIRERESVVTASAGARGLEALCSAYGQLNRARRRYQIAQTIPSALFVSAPSSQTRWAWDCAFPTPYEDAVRRAEQSEGLPRGLLWAVMRQESAFDPEAISAAHAVGLMQLMPQTARSISDELGLSGDDARLTNPAYSVRVGAHALRRMLDEMHDSVPLAVAAYNAGVESVTRWISRAPGMQIDTFVEHIPFRETKEYVARVMGSYAHYAYLAAGNAEVPKVSLNL